MVNTRRRSTKLRKNLRKHTLHVKELLLRTRQAFFQRVLVRSISGKPPWRRGQKGTARRSSRGRRLILSALPLRRGFGRRGSGPSSHLGIGRGRSSSLNGAGPLSLLGKSLSLKLFKRNGKGPRRRKGTNSSFNVNAQASTTRVAISGENRRRGGSANHPLKPVVTEPT